MDDKIKILVLGDSDVGKPSLMSVLLIIDLILVNMLL